MDRARKLDQLIDGAEELLTNLADVDSTDVRQLRERVDRAIDEARISIDERGEELSVQFGDVARTLNEYVRSYPWLALTTAVFIAGSVAFIAGATIGAKK